MQPQTLQHITAMITALGQGSEDPDLLIRAYVFAIDGVREDVIRDVCGQFMRGEVKDFKLGRRPATDVFAKTCRDWQKTVEANEFRNSRKQIVQQEEQRAADHSVEHREKMKNLLRHWSKAFRGDRESQRILERWGWKQNVAPSPYATFQSDDYELSHEQAETLQRMMALPDAINITAEQQAERRGVANKIEQFKSNNENAN